MRTRTLIKLHINGIQVDILKLPALYTAPSLGPSRQLSIVLKLAVVNPDVQQAHNTSSQHCFNTSDCYVDQGHDPYEPPVLPLYGERIPACSDVDRFVDDDRPEEREAPDIYLVV